MQTYPNIPGQPHRWAEAICAWARGELVQWRYASAEATDADWRDCDHPSCGMPNWHNTTIEFRAASAVSPSQAQSTYKRQVDGGRTCANCGKQWLDHYDNFCEPAGIQSPAAPVGGEVKMRSEFHAWVKDRGCDTDGAWSAWQACWNLLVEAQPQPTEGEDAVHAPRIARWLTEVTNNRRNTERARGAALALVDEWEGLEPSAPAMEGKTE